MATLGKDRLWRELIPGGEGGSQRQYRLMLANEMQINTVCEAAY